VKRHPRVGLRSRLIAALFLTSALTLVAAALALLPPLEHRLRTEDLEFLTQTALGASSGLRHLDSAQVRPGSPELRKLTRVVERHTGARVVVFDAAGRKLADTDPDEGPGDVRGGPFDDVARAFKTRKRVRDTVTSAGVSVGRVALPVSGGGTHMVLELRRSLEDVHSGAQAVKRAFTAAALVGLGTAIVLGVGLATTLLRRLRRLQDAARRLTVHGLNAEMPSDNARDEVGELARTFETMQTRLRQQEGVRRAFVATASHEIRTPLASLDAQLELLGDDLEAEPPDLDDAREQVVAAQVQSRRMSALANDLLELTRLDTDFSLRKELTEAGEICRAVIAEFELRASKRGVQLELRNPEAACWVYGDPDSIARIVRILVDNALRVSPVRETVTVTVSAESEFGEVSVSDLGPGVRPEESVLIFERFKRGSTTGEEPGFGLGLAIGRELAERMGGTLRLEDSQVGARFTLRVPLAPYPGGDGESPSGEGS
jgi:signal transduction histidine kinase